MTKSQRNDVLAFAVGIFSHLVFWLLVLDWDFASVCSNGDCWGLIIFDIPVSFFYSGNPREITHGSLVFGTIWWGVLGILIKRFTVYLIRAFKNEIGIK